MVTGSQGTGGNNANTFPAVVIDKFDSVKLLLSVAPDMGLPFKYH